MNCPDVRAQLVAYDDGELEDAEARSIARHLQECPQCRRELSRLQEVARHLGETAAIDPGPVFRTQVMAAIVRTRPVHSRTAIQALRPIAISVALGGLIAASVFVLGVLSIDFAAWQIGPVELGPLLDAIGGATPALVVTLSEAAWPVVVQFSGTVMMALVVDIALIIALVIIARKWRQGKLAGRTGAILA